MPLRDGEDKISLAKAAEVAAAKDERPVKRGTVVRWIKEGKLDGKGQRVKLESNGRRPIRTSAEAVERFLNAIGQDADPAATTPPSAFPVRKTERAKDAAATLDRAGV